MSKCFLSLMDSGILLENANGFVLLGSVLLIYFRQNLDSYLRLDLNPL